MTESLPAIREVVVWLSGILGTAAASFAVTNSFPKVTPTLTAFAAVLAFIANKLPRAETKVVKELKADVHAIKQEAVSPSAEAGLKIRESLAAAKMTYGPEGAQ